MNSALLAPSGEKDYSRADFTWCCTALRWGWPPAEVKDRLLMEPLSKAVRLLKERHPDARGRAEKYAEITVNNAADAVFGIGVGDRIG